MNNNNLNDSNDYNNLYSYKIKLRGCMYLSI